MMVLNKEDHRAILLELLDRAQFHGAARNLIYELGQAIEWATVANDPHGLLATAGVERINTEPQEESEE